MKTGDILEKLMASTVAKLELLIVPYDSPLR